MQSGGEVKHLSGSSVRVDWAFACFYNSVSVMLAGGLHTLQEGGSKVCANEYGFWAETREPTRVGGEDLSARFAMSLTSAVLYRESWGDRRLMALTGLCVCIPGQSYRQTSPGMDSSRRERGPTWNSASSFLPDPLSETRCGLRIQGGP